MSALTSLRGTTAAIAGPALAGVCIAAFGLPFTFGVDAATFAVSLVALSAIRAMPPAEDAPPPASVEHPRRAALRGEPARS